MLKKFKYFLLLIPIFLTGCWDSRDINERSIIITLGIESAKDQIEFSGEIANLKTNNKQESDITYSTYNILSHGKTIEDARYNLNLSIPYPVFLGATRAVVFGSNFAKKGIEPYLNRIDSLYDYRKTVLTVVTRESPTEIFKVGTERHLSVGFLIEDILFNNTKSGKAIYTETGELLSYIAMGKVGYILPYIGIEKDTIQLLGYAVFKNSKLIEIIDHNQTNGIVYILADKPKIVQNIQDIKNKKNTYSVETTVNKRNIKTNYFDNQVKIEINMDILAKLRYQYFSKLDNSNITLIEQSLSQIIKKEISDLIEKAQTEYKCDIFHFYKNFKADNPKIAKKIDWEQAFNAADIQVNVKTKVIDTNQKVNPEEKDNNSNE